MRLAFFAATADRGCNCESTVQPLRRSRKKRQPHGSNRFLGVFEFPVAAGLVDNLARPTGNISLVSPNMISELSAKRLELLKESVPKLSRIAVMWEPHIVSSAQQWKESELAAKKLGLQIHSMQIRGPNQDQSAFKEAAAADSVALAVTLTPTFLLPIRSRSRIWLSSIGGLRSMPTSRPWTPEAS